MEVDADVEIEPMVEKPAVADTRTDEERMVDEMLIDIIEIDSDDDKVETVKQKIKEEIDDMFTFSNNEFEKEGDFDMINQLNETILESPEIEQPVPQAETSRRPESAPTQSEAIVSWERSRIKVAFLEDSEKKIFVHRIRELDIVKVLDIKKFNHDRQIEYMHMMRSQQAERFVKTKQRIVTIKNIITRRLVHV